MTSSGVSIDGRHKTNPVANGRSAEVLYARQGHRAANFLYPVEISSVEEKASREGRSWNEKYAHERAGVGIWQERC